MITGLKSRFANTDFSFADYINFRIAAMFSDKYVRDDFGEDLEKYFENLHDTASRPCDDTESKQSDLITELQISIEHFVFSCVLKLVKEEDLVKEEEDEEKFSIEAFMKEALNNPITCNKLRETIIPLIDLHIQRFLNLCDAGQREPHLLRLHGY